MTQGTMETDIAARLKNLKTRLSDMGVDGALILDKVSLYYLTGTDQDAHLWVPVQGQPLLMVRKSLARAEKDALVAPLLPLPSLSHLAPLIQDHTGGIPGRIGLEMDILPALFYEKYRKLFPRSRFIDISPAVRLIRMRKSPVEQSHIRKAAAVADRLFEKVPDFLRESKTETDLALRAEAFYRSQGHPGLVRTRAFNSECHYGHIMAGKGAAEASNAPGPTGGRGLGPFFSQGAGSHKIGKNESIVVDYAASVSGYIADQTRIYVLGTLPEKFHRAYRVMVEVQDTIAEKGRPGVRAKDLYHLALDIVEKNGLTKGFMGYPDPVPFVGHGLGLEIDEWPVIGNNNGIRLEEGMALALEPKVVFPGEGVVGIENTFIVTQNGLERLCRFPDDIVSC